MTIERWVMLILLGGLLGVVGQGIRLAAGLKKLNDEAAASEVELRSLLHPSRIVVSLIIGFVAGALGAVALVSGDVAPGAAEGAKATGTLEPVTIVTLIGIGYAGTDFIEAFISKHGRSFARGTAPNDKKRDGDGAAGETRPQAPVDQPPPVVK